MTEENHVKSKFQRPKTQLHWKTARFHLCTMRGYFCVTMTEPRRSCNQDCVASKTKNIYFLVLYRKSSPGSALDLSSSDKRDINI
jgi:hypothetical protein